ncbi:hypothetical protein TcWFU_006690 [Taenia crassiceps]|uniref:Uncharacterized protein n=1 Tax=Taenia crassiceps TaxID=6207 RepID=A0ABR4Q9L3_9CEST
MSSQSASLAHGLVNYKYRDAARIDIEKASQAYHSLQLKLQDFTFENGQTSKLLCLEGTIPVKYMGNVYNIPMQIKAGPNVDTNGKIFLPYLSEWKFPGSSTQNLLEILQDVFGHRTPVFSKPTVNQNPASYVGFNTNVGSSNGCAYGMPGVGWGGMPGLPGSTTPTASGSATPQPSLFGGVMPSMPSVPTTSTFLGSATGFPAGALSEEEQLLLSLRSAVLDKLNNVQREVVDDLSCKIQSLESTERDLISRADNLDTIRAQMLSELDQIQSLTRELVGKAEEYKETYRKLKQETDVKVDYDSVVDTTTPVYRQLVEAFAEEQAIGDVLYYLSQALENGAIKLEDFLKVVRDQSRSQFMKRATVCQCRAKAGLPPSLLWSLGAHDFREMGDDCLIFASTMLNLVSCWPTAQVKFGYQQMSCPDKAGRLHEECLTDGMPNSERHKLRGHEQLLTRLGPKFLQRTKGVTRDTSAMLRTVECIFCRLKTSLSTVLILLEEDYENVVPNHDQQTLAELECVHCEFLNHHLLTMHRLKSSQSTDNLQGPLPGDIVCVWKVDNHSGHGSLEHALKCPGLLPISRHEISDVCGGKEGIVSVISDSSSEFSVIVGGLSDGSLVVWDLDSEVVPLHQSDNILKQSSTLPKIFQYAKSPDYLASYAFSENDKSSDFRTFPTSPIISLKSLICKSTLSENFQFCSLDNRGNVNIWMVLRLQSRRSHNIIGSTTDLGMRPGSQARLIQLARLTYDTESSRMKYAKHQTDSSQRAYPEYFTLSFTVASVTCLSLHPFLPNVLIAGYSDGQIALFLTHRPHPIFKWLIKVQSDWPLIGVRKVIWSPHRPIVAFCLATDGDIIAWTLLDGEQAILKPRAQTLIIGTIRERKVVDFSVARGRSGCLAVCWQDGAEIHWLEANLVVRQEDELLALENTLNALL